MIYRMSLSTTSGQIMWEKFNLVENKWIKVHEGRLSLYEFFNQSKAPMLSGTAVEKLVVFRLLLAVLQRACPIETEDDYEELSIDEMKETARDYLIRNKDSFNLRDEKAPFLQHPEISSGGKEHLIGAFFPGACSGNTTILFDANEPRKRLSNEDAAYVLLQQVTFAAGGKKHDKDILFSEDVKKGRNAKPSPALGKGWLHTFPVGDDLYETLKLNLISEQMLHSSELSFLTGIGIPPWEKMPLTEKGGYSDEYKQTLIGWLVPISRFGRIIETEDEERFRFTEGIEYPRIDSGWCDLSVSLKNPNEKKSKISAVQASRGIEPWRQLDAVLAFFDLNKNSGCRQLHVIFKERQPDVRGMWCLGVQMSENSGEQYMSGSDDFVESFFKIKREMIGSKFLAAYKSHMREIDRIRRCLYSCVCRYYDELKASELGPRHANRAVEKFWGMCSQAGVRLVEVCGSEEAADLMRVFQQAAIEAYAEVCPRLSSRALMAYEKSRPIFKLKDGGEK